MFVRLPPIASSLHSRGFAVFLGRSSQPNSAAELRKFQRSLDALVVKLLDDVSCLKPGIFSRTSSERPNGISS